MSSIDHPIGSRSTFAAGRRPRRRSWRACMPAVVALLLLTFGTMPAKTLMAQADPAFLVKDINTVALNGGSEPWNLFAVGDEVYFTAQERFHGREMWRSDGTPNGTELVKDILPGEGSLYNCCTEEANVGAKEQRAVDVDQPGG
jgi:ELWxxDGT repeat protein